MTIWGTLSNKTQKKCHLFQYLVTPLAPIHGTLVGRGTLVGNHWFNKMSFTVSNMLKIGLTNMDLNLKCDNLFFGEDSPLCYTYGRSRFPFQLHLHLSQKGREKLKVKNQYLIEQNMYFETRIFTFQWRGCIVVIKFHSIEVSSMWKVFDQLSNFISFQTNEKVSISLQLYIFIPFISLFLSLSFFRS